MKKNRDAIKLFLKQEGEELRGKKNTNIIILFSIFLAAILSVGFGGASLSYLKYKMDDPFVDWVEIYAVQKVSDQSSVISLKDFIENAQFQEEYHFREPEDQHELYIDFVHTTTQKPIQLGGRNIESTSKVFEKILSEDNVICMNQLGFSDDQLAIIVTQDALKKLGYSIKDEPAFLYLSLQYDDSICSEIGLAKVNEGYPVAFPVYAIVKQLPGMYSFMFSDEFLHDRCATNTTSWDITDNNNNLSLNYVVENSKLQGIEKKLRELGYNNLNVSAYRQSWSDSLSAISISIEAECCKIAANQMSEKINNLFSSSPSIDYNDYTINYKIDSHKAEIIKKQLSDSGLHYLMLPNSATDSVSEISIELNIDNYRCSAANKLERELNKVLNGATRIYNFEPVYDYELDRPEKISVHIDDLKYIRDFQNALYDKCGYKIDMTNVDAKENFNFVQRMGNVLSVCIIIIASLLICFFIYFMLSSHFQRIQKNLGTFKAFGISNKVLTSIYMRLMIRMTVISFVSAFVVSFGLSKLFDLIYPPLEEGYPWIDVLVIPNLILFVLVMVATFVSTKIVNRKLNNTPGDLIYNRVN